MSTDLCPDADTSTDWPSSTRPHKRVFVFLFMEDREELLREFGIVKDRWVSEQGPATESRCKLPSPLKESQKECNPRESEFDPYAMVASLIQNLELSDLNNAQMALANSLNESLQEREKLVRKHFSVFVKCRVLLENASNLKGLVEKTQAVEQIQQVRVLEQILGPLLREHKALEKKERQAEFIRGRRLLFEGPEILEEHLNLMDLPAFLSDYARAKQLAESYKGSKFVSFLWSRFIKVIARFKTEVSRKVETSTAIFECIHYINLYIQVEPHSAGRMFGTFLTVAKKEFYQQLKLLEQRAVGAALRPHRALVEHINALIGIFVFMVRSMAAADFIYNQDKQMEEFIASGLENLAATSIEGIEILFSGYERDSSPQAQFDQRLLPTAGEIIKRLQQAEDALELEDIELPKSSHLEKLHHRLLALLLAQAHTLPQEKLPEVVQKIHALVGANKDITKAVKKTVSNLITRTVQTAAAGDGAEPALKALVLLRASTLPKLSSALPELAAQVETELTQQETLLQGKVARGLRKQLEKVTSEEEFLMVVLKTKTSLAIPGVNSEQVTRQVIQTPLLRLKLTPLLEYYLQKYLPRAEGKAGREDARVQALGKQLSLLLK